MGRLFVLSLLVVLLAACSSDDDTVGVKFPAVDPVQVGELESASDRLATIEAARIEQPTLFTCLDCELHTVAQIIDGDTLDLTDGTRVRAFGYDTPELDERCYTEATDRLRRIVGSTVRLEDGPVLEDQFGRRLAYLYTGDGISIDALMVFDGLAEAWQGEGQHQSALISLMKLAQDESVGCLWGGG